jgi:hypothetical protein
MMEYLMVHTMEQQKDEKMVLQMAHKTELSMAQKMEL